MKKEELEVIKKIDRDKLIEIEEYLKDPCIKDFIFILNEKELDYSHIYTIKKYILNLELSKTTKIKKRIIVYLFNNLRLLYRIINNNTSRRIFLFLQYPRNISQIAKKVERDRKTIRYWINYLLELELIMPHEWGGKNESLYRRNLPERQFEISLIDALCKNKHTEIAKEEFEKRYST